MVADSTKKRANIGISFYEEVAVLPEGINLNNPLWDYALGVYPQLSKPLLALQQQGARVNQLLAALWCADTGREWPGAVDAEIESWHCNQVLPIRQRRMTLKPQLALYPELESLYQSYKQVELNCERVELAMLYRWLEPLACGQPISAQQNIDAVLRLNGVAPDTAARDQLFAAMQH